MTYTDYELGAQHGRLGLDEKYPNNINYHKGYCVGYTFFQRELEETRPFEELDHYSVNADYIGSHL